MLRKAFDKIEPAFTDGGPLRLFYPVYEAIDTFLFSDNQQTSGAPHVRDAMDLKRMMVMVVVALTPCVLMAMWNTGYQANLSLEAMGSESIPGWRGQILAAEVVITTTTTTMAMATTTSSSTTSTTVPSPSECGDMDASGVVGATDALILLQKAVGLEVDLRCPDCPNPPASGAE